METHVERRDRVPSVPRRLGADQPGSLRVSGEAEHRRSRPRWAVRCRQPAAEDSSVACGGTARRLAGGAGMAWRTRRRAAAAGPPPRC